MSSRNQRKIKSSVEGMRKAITYMFCANLYITGLGSLVTYRAIQEYDTYLTIVGALLFVVTLYMTTQLIKNIRSLFGVIQRLAYMRTVGIDLVAEPENFAKHSAELLIAESELRHYISIANKTFLLNLNLGDKKYEER